MKRISYPKCNRSGVRFVIFRNEDLSENIWFLSDDFPIAMYTQSYDHAASDHIPFHWHDEIQVVWVYQGTLTYQVNGHTFPLDRGKLLFINSRLLHSSRTIKGDAKTLCIDFSQRIFHPMVLKHYIQPVLEDSTCTYMCLPLKPYYLDTLEQFTNWDEKLLGYFSVTNFLSQLVEDIVKNFKGDSAPVDYEEVRRFNAILEYVHNQYSEPLTVALLAKTAHLNKNRLTALFKKYTNMTPVKYLNEYRLYVAKNLITSTDLSISQISEDVGYHQISHFIQQFRKSYGMTPLKYRNRYSRTSDIPETIAKQVGDGTQ